MKLSNILNQLAHGELKNVFVAELDEGAGDLIDPENVRKLLVHINLGLSVLHTRFLLKERSHILDLEEGKTTYTLDLDDLLRIERVEDLYQNEHLVNVMDDPESFHTPDYKTLTLPKEWPNEKRPVQLQIFYRADHKPIPLTKAFDQPETVDVDLPPTHLEALCYFIASRVMNPIGSSDGFHEGNNYASKFEQACQRLVHDGFGITQTESSDQFRNLGWV